MDSRKTKILLIEDDNITRLFIKEILENENYLVAAYSNGFNIIQKVMANNFSLIILDIVLADGEDGIEICKKLKKKKTTKDIPVIFLTGQTDKKILVKAFAAGGLDYLAKPFVEKELVVRINTHVTLEKQRLKLVAAKQKAEQADRKKSEFLVNISHEIRSPLNSVIGFSELLMDKNYSDVNEKYMFSEHIHSSGERLLMLINDIIDLSKIESGKIKIFKENFSVGIMLTNLKDLFEKEKEKRGLDNVKLLLNITECEDDVYLFSDKKRIEQVFSNLLINALKFTDRGSIEIGCFKKEFNGLPFIVFYVKDTGVGIPKDKHKIIFERFGQDDNTLSRNFEGTGLGLSISKKLVTLLGGKIWVESEKGIGSSFFFSTPYFTKNVDVDKIKNHKELLSVDWSDKN
ncbi:MAG: hybrid sensor histidine kinase/response regulator, partial [Bacteroidota bacterium]|nr:hybrid sensor histidine kinase/response regulator [Bacteroidota bacterium]